MNDLYQTCWVVPDLEAAAQQWVKHGVGPFILLDIDLPDAIYRGRPEPLKMLAGLAQAGPMQIELIQQISDGPSAYRDTVAKGQSGWHHVARIVPDYEDQVERLRARGIAIATEAAFDGKPFCYADTRSEIGAMLELIPESPFIREINEVVAAAARSWDGRTVTKHLA